jgi:hypothetical protein
MTNTRYRFNSHANVLHALELVRKIHPKFIWFIGKEGDEWILDGDNLG